MKHESQNFSYALRLIAFVCLCGTGWWIIQKQKLVTLDTIRNHFWHCASSCGGDIEDFKVGPPWHFTHIGLDFVSVKGHVPTF